MGGIIAGAAVALGVGLFVATRLDGSTPTLATLQADSLPLDVALANPKPTLLEFYATWCETCREMVPDTFAVERQFADDVNFVMLNIDNTRWSEEVMQIVAPVATSPFFHTLCNTPSCAPRDAMAPHAAQPICPGQCNDLPLKPLRSPDASLKSVTHHPPFHWAMKTNRWVSSGRVGQVLRPPIRAAAVNRLAGLCLIFCLRCRRNLLPGRAS